MKDSVSDSGVAEIVGALMLIAIIGLGVAIAGVYFLNHSVPEKIPEFRASLANTSTNLTLHHDGGESIPRSSFKILINGNPTDYVSSNASSPDWSIDDTLTFSSYDPATPLPDVKIVYNGSAGERVLADFGSVITYTPTHTITPTTSTTTAPVPCSPVASFMYFPPNPDTSTLVIFQDTSTCTPTSWDWTSSDGWTSITKNPTHTFATAGTYTVRLVSRNVYGTSAPFTMDINVTSGGGGVSPVAGFTANTTSGCTPLSVQFTDTSSGSPTSWSWSFGDGGISTLQNPVHTYVSPGSYNVSLTATNSDGSNTKTQLNFIIVGQVPIANFNANLTMGCLPMNVQFNDTSTGVPTTWIWTFDDGTTSTDQNPVKIYTTTGNYTVSLTARNSCGNSIPFSRTNYITVNSAPVANFIANVTIGCQQLTVQFTNTSTGNPTSWIWTFGDGTTSTDQNPVKIYTTTGNYTVSLTAGNSCGNSIPFNKANYITVNPVPVASFFANLTIGCQPMTVNFIDTTLGASTWNWTFGDGTTSTDQNPVKTYTSAGNYTVSLTAGDSCGNSIPYTRPGYIIINPVPIANFTTNITTGCPPLTVRFTNTSTGNPTSWTWTFGDGTTSTAQNPVKTYTSAGNYTVSLTAGNSCGNGTTYTRTDCISVKAAPVANFTANVTTGCQPLNIRFTSTSTIGNPTSWTWTFGDGTTSKEQNPVKTYTTAGTYTISLTAGNSCGNSTQFTRTNYITVNKGPVAAFNAIPASGTAPLTVQFTDQSAANITSWNWNFGDGIGTSSQQNPTYTYITTGTYNVNLTVTNACNKNSTISQVVISQPTCGSIAGTKWNDLNGDGNRDPGEPGLAGWRINVRWQSNNTIAGSAITNANGDYIVTGLLYIGPDVDTKYVVEEVLQSGWTQTYPSSGVWNVHLKEKSDSCYATGNDFGNHLIKSLSGFTAEVWVKWNIPPNAGGNSSRTWATIVVDGDSDSNSRYHLQHNSDNTLFEFAAATNLSRQYAQSTTSPTINTWYYVVGVYNQTDPTNNRIKIYVNGTLEKSVVIDNGGLKASPNRYQVGGPAGIQWPGPTSMLRKFDGDIRGLYTYERAMDPSEVASRFAAGLPAF